MSNFLDILKNWERTEVNPVIYEHIDVLFPAYGFVRVKKGSDKDRWVSPLKMDLSLPKTPNKEKTVVSLCDFRFREQGEWDNSVGVIDKLMEDYGYSSLFDLYKSMADRFSILLPTSSFAYNRVEDRRSKVLEALCDYFKWNLAHNTGAACKRTREYLHKRGFTQDWIDKLEFGFVPSWDKVESYITAARMRFTKEELDNACKVTSDDGYTTIGKKHVLAIPYRCGGDLKGFLFRSIDNDIQPKYKANIGLDRKNCFFNISSSREDKEIIVVEGEMDALTATAVGIENVVAIGGSDISGERRMQIYDAIGRNTKKITLCLDLDANANGQPNGIKRFNAVRKSLHTIFDVSLAFNEVYVACFPEVTDPDEFIRTHGKEAFLKVIHKAVPWWEYLNRNLQRK